MEAESILTAEAVVVFALGAQLKEHGPHLKLNNDWVMAEYLSERILASEEVVVLPTMPFSYYPAFLEYPGSISLDLQTATEIIIQIVRGIAKFGPRQFYVINTGISTLRALADAAKSLLSDGTVLAYTDFHAALEPARAIYGEQEGGGHADEVETSIMLYIAPDSVEMSKTVNDYSGDTPGPLSRRRDGYGTYSPTGIWGNPTLASAKKGRIFTEALLEAISKDITELRAK